MGEGFDGVNLRVSLARRASGAFTLIEMLVVLAVIGILLGIFFSGMPYVHQLLAERRARTEITALRTSVTEYHGRFGAYPHCSYSEQPCTPGECLFLSLVGFHNEYGGLQIPPYRPCVNPTLFEFDPDTFDLTQFSEVRHEERMKVALFLAAALRRDPVFIDPWGKEYVYEYPRRNGAHGFRIYSLGPDGEEGDEFDEDNIE